MNYEVKLARRYRDDEELSSNELTRRYRTEPAKSIKEQAEAFDLEHPIMGILG
jgi:hypothetical protein